MAGKNSIFMGQRIRRLRRELGLTQAAMAEDLEVSSSYIALIEGNQRAVTAATLLKLAEVYRTDISSLIRGSTTEFNTQIAAVFNDPIFADLGISSLEIDDMATTFPSASEAILRLYAAYQEGQLALADKGEGSPVGSDPVNEARRFLTARKNYFADIDDQAEELAAKIVKIDGYENYFRDQRLRVRRVPSDIMMGFSSRFEPHRKEILLDVSLDTASANFQLALQVAYLEIDSNISKAMEGNSFDTESGKKLARRALVNYAAGALLMPYRAFLKAARNYQYDVEAIARQFGVSFEQVAHRLTTLQKPGQEGVPFFFIRVDQAGNVSKRLDGAGFPFARHGGSCPLWNLHQAFSQPGEVLTQWLELPDGERFFSIVRTVTAGGGGYGRPKVFRAVALCCSSQHSKDLIYSKEQDAPSESATPIGVNCRLCHRSKCLARAEPPLGRSLLHEDIRRPSTPFSLADGTS